MLPHKSSICLTKELLVFNLSLCLAKWLIAEIDGHTMLSDKGNNDEWADRLRNLFSGPSGIIGERVFAVHDAEESCIKSIRQEYGNYDVLLDSFLDFHVESFQIINSQSMSGDVSWSKDSAFQCALQVNMFWRFEASYNLFWRGYFTEGLSLLRAIFENVLHLSGINLGITTVDKWIGIYGGEDIDKISPKDRYKKIQNSIRRNDKKLRRKIIGASSGLDSDIVEDMDDFFKILHNAVHKCTLSFLYFSWPWLQGKSSIPIFPVFKKEPAENYINYSIWIGWMLLRMLSFLMKSLEIADSSWVEKYSVLDNSFSVASKTKKRMSESVVAFIQRKLNIDSD